VRRDDEDEGRIDHRPSAYEAVARGLPARTGVHVGERIVGDELARPAHLRHHAVAGVDTQTAADAIELLAVADVDAGRTDTHAEAAVDAMAASCRRRSRLGIGARLAAPGLVGNDQRMLVEHRRLEARPGAHIDANLLARPPREKIGRGREEADKTIDRGARLAGEDAPHDAGSVVEIHDPGTASEQRDQKPDRVLRSLLPDLGERQTCSVKLQAFVAVALDPTLDPHEKIGPHGLRTSKPTPDSTEERGGQKQTDGAEDKQPGKVVYLLRPDLDDEEIGAAPRHIDMHDLIGRSGSTVPPDPRHEIIDAQKRDQHRPLDATEQAADSLRIYFDTIGV